MTYQTLLVSVLHSTNISRICTGAVHISEILANTVQIIPFSVLFYIIPYRTLLIADR